ncbi:uncharacterized protein BX663DRAFT_500910 [Cokeromyces recurvatus]|uniref:uncharacterized protein n=1 Tax=Cokeromyces recurvatus TaxID=90255 RepID=UPI00221FDB01|nr:uncharacterized protein BX663DRAFT_500910 [Cokeromyces recurvatus]KAI7905787.1 hypothetical protein BX663DRAFT_500910 [Cokeromyces recurvatus]
MADKNNSSNNSHTNAFLKNLSQKKYAWMEEAIASTTNISSPTSTVTPSSSKKNKKQKLSIDKKPNKVLKQPKTSPSPMTVPKTEDIESIVQTPTDYNVAVKESKPKQQPLFKYTTFPVKGYNILPTRNITSTYARGDISYFSGSKAGAEEISPNPEEEYSDIIVIHPGSRNLRIGLASEAFPISIPHVIARRYNTSLFTNTTQVDETSMDKEKYDEALNEIRGELKWRMKNAKRRAVPNAEGQVIGFNTNAPKETIPDHNDPYKVEWTDVSTRADFFVGEKALNVPIADNSEYRINYPWKYGTINNQDYNSINEVLEDLEVIWTESIVNELEIERNDFKNYNAILVIPDMLDHEYLCDLVRMMLRYMKFKAVIIQQESACATYGAGVSSAVVVDIGAQTTNISCIEDGVCQVDSRILIRVGGDDVTRTFTSFLLSSQFPYADIDLNTTYDWRLAETLKQKWCTMNEADISVQVYDFFARTPFKPTLKYQCKVYEEVFLAPLCLVYPDILEPRSKNTLWSHKDVTDDVIVDDNNNINNKAQEYDTHPIDTAIAQSIEIAANGSEEKLKRYFTSIILVGGGGKIVNFSKVLEDRVLSTIIAQKLNIDKVEVLPPPRDLDPEVLVWKGASVVAKLDSSKDMWIGNIEWEEMGSRCIRERALLM